MSIYLYTFSSITFFTLDITLWKTLFYCHIISACFLLYYGKKMGGPSILFVCLFQHGLKSLFIKDDFDLFIQLCPPHKYCNSLHMHHLIYSLSYHWIWSWDFFLFARQSLHKFIYITCYNFQSCRYENFIGFLSFLSIVKILWLHLAQLLYNLLTILKHETFFNFLKKNFTSAWY